MRERLRDIVAAVVGRPVSGVSPLSGGCVGEVWKVTVAGGEHFVAKIGPGLEPEAWMLRTLAERSRLPVPRLLHGDDTLLLMEWVDGDDGLDERAQAHAGELWSGSTATTASTSGRRRMRANCCGGCTVSARTLSASSAPP